MTGPLCRVCGRPIKKKTTEVAFGVEKAGHIYQTFRPDRVSTLAEAARLVNGEILSSRRGYGDRKGEIAAVNVWDGASYVDDHFDTERCAAQFGRSMAEAHPTWAFPAYRRAVEKLAAKA